MVEAIGPSVPEERLRPALRLEMHGFSVPKESHRPNEDTIIFSPEFGYAGVFDGLGGTQKGALASQTAGAFLSEKLKDDLDDGYVTGYILSILGSTSKKVTEETKGNGQTTAALVKLIDLRLAWASIGDSRIYLLRNGKLEQLSIDDNLLSDVARFSLHGEHLQALREVSRKLDDVAQWRFSRLSGRKPPMARNVFPNRIDAEGNILEYLYRNRHIVRKALGVPSAYDTLGFDRPNPWNVGVQVLRPGDRIALTSDGVHDNLVWRNIKTILKSDVKDPAQALVQFAFKRSKGEHFRAKRDDISAVVIDVKAA